MTKTTFLAAGLVCLSAFAQDKPAPKKGVAPPATGAPAAPIPGPEMKEIRGMIGTWTTEETYEQSPMMPAGTGTGNATMRLGPGGFSILLDVRSKTTAGAFSGHAVFAWDANEKAYKQEWVDSMTPGVVTQTGHKDGDNLVFTGEVNMMGKKIATKDVYSDRKPDSFTITSYANDGSGEKKIMTIKATRAAAPAAPAKK